MRRRSIWGSNPTNEDDYSVGYGRPPIHTRFQKGKTGNPRGRPRRRKNYATLVRQFFDKQIPIRDGERVRKVSKLEAMIHRHFFNAMKGDTKSLTALMNLAAGLGQFEPELPPPPSLIFNFVSPGKTTQNQNKG